MDNGLIPRRYAKALYKLAKDHGTISTVYDEMRDVVESFRQNPSLQKALSNPYINDMDKAELLRAAAGNKVENDYLGFVKLVLEQRREDLFCSMALAFRDIYRQENHISQVRIITATQLPEKEMVRIRSMVASSFPSQKLEYTYEINPDIIGGFIIDVDDTRMDASLSNELEQLRLNLIHS